MHKCWAITPVYTSLLRTTKKIDALEQANPMFSIRKGKAWHGKVCFEGPGLSVLYETGLSTKYKNSSKLAVSSYLLEDNWACPPIISQLGCDAMISTWKCIFKSTKALLWGGATGAVPLKDTWTCHHLALHAGPGTSSSRGKQGCQVRAVLRLAPSWCHPFLMQEEGCRAWRGTCVGLSSSLCLKCFRNLRNRLSNAIIKLSVNLCNKIHQQRRWVI